MQKKYTIAVAFLCLLAIPFANAQKKAAPKKAALPALTLIKVGPNAKQYPGKDTAWSFWGRNSFLVHGTDTAYCDSAFIVNNCVFMYKNVRIVSPDGVVATGDRMCFCSPGKRK